MSARSVVIRASANCAGVAALHCLRAVVMVNLYRAVRIQEALPVMPCDIFQAAEKTACDGSKCMIRHEAQTVEPHHRRRKRPLNNMKLPPALGTCRKVNPEVKGCALCRSSLTPKPHEVVTPTSHTNLCPCKARFLVPGWFGCFSPALAPRKKALAGGAL